MTDDTPALPEEGGDNLTESVDVRFPYTNDVVGGLLLFTLPMLVYLGGSGIIDLDALPQEILWTYGTIVVGTAIWMFGVDALSAAHDIRSK